MRSAGDGADELGFRCDGLTKGEWGCFLAGIGAGSDLLEDELVVLLCTVILLASIGVRA